MKKPAILAMALLLCLTRLFPQSCLPSGITFNTQSAIDNFHNNYPGCTEIGGSVHILGWEVHNLNGLSGLTSIGGDLWIIYTGMLNDISGLSSLTHIGGSLRMDGAQYVTSLAGLSSLEQVGGSLSIGDYDGNTNLHNLNGLENLQSIGGGLQIWFNQNLESLEGLENVTSLGGDIDIYHNPNLESLSGLEGLTSLPGYLYIGSNFSLSSLAGLQNLVSVGEHFIMGLSYSLPSLEGLENLASVGDKLELSYNHLLTDLSGLDNLVHIGAMLVIEGNDGLTSLSGMPGLTEVSGSLYILHNEAITSLAGLEMIETIGNDLEITDNDYLSELTGLTNLEMVGGSVEIYDNPFLGNLDGIENLSTIGMDLYVHGNAVLTDISALAGLESVGMDFEISDNDQLESLEGLYSLNPGSINNLNIWDNASLSSCAAAGICGYLANPGGTVNIHTNAPGCNYPHEIAEACGMTMPCLPYGNYFFYTQEDLDSFPLNYPGCTELGGSVFIYGPDIGNLDGLAAVTSIADNFRIEANQALSDLGSLENLSSIGGVLTIMNCPGITTLSGIDNLDPLALNSLRLQNNALLAECNVESICYYINNFWPSTIISNNGTGCNSIQQVAAACGVLSSEDRSDSELVSVFPNPGDGKLHFAFHISSCQYIRLGIYDVRGNEVAVLADGQYPAGGCLLSWDASDLPGGVYIYRFISANGFTSGKLVLLN